MNMIRGIVIIAQLFFVEVVIIYYRRDLEIEDLPGFF